MSTTFTADRDATGVLGSSILKELRIRQRERLLVERAQNIARRHREAYAAAAVTAAGREDGSYSWQDLHDARRRYYDTHPQHEAREREAQDLTEVYRRALEHEQGIGSWRATRPSLPTTAAATSMAPGLAGPLSRECEHALAYYQPHHERFEQAARAASGGAGTTYGPEDYRNAQLAHFASSPEGRRSWDEAQQTIRVYEQLRDELASDTVIDVDPAPSRLDETYENAQRIYRQHLEGIAVQARADANSTDGRYDARQFHQARESYFRDRPGDLEPWQHAQQTIAFIDRLHREDRLQRLQRGALPASGWVGELYQHRGRATEVEAYDRFQKLHDGLHAEFETIARTNATAPYDTYTPEQYESAQREYFAARPDRERSWHEAQEGLRILAPLQPDTRPDERDPNSPTLTAASVAERLGLTTQSPTTPDDELLARALALSTAQSPTSTPSGHPPYAPALPPAEQWGIS